MHLAPGRRLTLFALMCLVYFTTSGGAFGVEPLVGAVGPGWAVVLLLVTPLIWSLPMALMVAELTTLMPEEGGFYVWVREALGAFWALQNAWWTMAYSLVLMALFPVLFVSYLSFFLPALAPAAGAAHSVSGALVRWLVGAFVIVSAMAVNLRGVRNVGRTAKVGAFVVVGSFALLVLIWLQRGPSPATVAKLVAHDFAAEHKGALLLGLSIVLLNYGGWDSASTYAGEVDRPQRNYPLAIGGALLACVLTYVLPVLAGLSASADPAVWSADQGWPVISQLIGGPRLGHLIAAAGLISMWVLFNAQLLFVSRLPYVLACDGWLPSFIARVSPDAGVPSAAIVVFSGLTALLTVLSFDSLAVILCLLNTAALTLEFLALIVMRVSKPGAHRSFRVPGGWWGMAYVCLTPFATATLVLIATLRDWRSYPGQLGLVGLVVLTGTALYFARREGAMAARLVRTGAVRRLTSRER